MVKEKTLIVVKHDGVLRGLVGDILSRFERVGLKIIAMKMIWADENIADKHYHVSEEWAKSVFDKTKTAYEKERKKFPFTDHKKYGQMIKDWNKNFLREGPVVAAVVEGPHAIELVRKMVGHTEPRQAQPGTIRGDYSYDSYALGDLKQRPTRNLIHASGTKDEAAREIALWFTQKEVYNYPTQHDKHS